MAVGIDRITVNPGTGFDPENPAHVRKVTDAVEKNHGTGFELENFEPATGKATLRRENRAVIASHTGNEAIEVPLPSGTTTSHGDKRALAFADAYPGYTMTIFEPHRRRAILAKIDEGTVRARDALSTALRCKAWDIQVSGRDEGGYQFTLPVSYTPSRHDPALKEVAEAIIGEPGWYFTTDTRKRTGELIPAELKTFEPSYLTPLPATPPAIGPYDDQTMRVPLGIALPAPGGEHQIQYMDLDAHQNFQIGGIAGAGKSVVVNAHIAQVLAGGSKLAIIDTPDKAVDFLWCKDFVMEGGWGCENIFEAAAVTRMIGDEKRRRAKILAEHGVQNWKQLPREAALPLITVIIDEVTVLFDLEKVPKVGRDAPQVMIDLKDEAEAINLAKEILKKGINRIAAEMRFAGISIGLSTQVASATTGLEPKLRTNLGHKALMGANPTENNRRLIFSDAESVPAVPEHVRENPIAARGTGAIEPLGSAPAVFKGYYRSPDEYRSWLEDLGVQKNTRIRPSQSKLAEIFGGAEMFAETDDDTDRFNGDEPDPDRDAPVFSGPAGSRAEVQHQAMFHTGDTAGH